MGFISLGYICAIVGRGFFIYYFSLGNLKQVFHQWELPVGALHGQNLEIWNILVKSAKPSVEILMLLKRVRFI